MRDEMSATLAIYRWPSQAFWRYFELKALKEIEYERPILEIGCGDGRLSALIFEEIDEGIDVNPRSVEKCRNSLSAKRWFLRQAAAWLTAQAETDPNKFPACASVVLARKSPAGG